MARRGVCGGARLHRRHGARRVFAGVVSRVAGCGVQSAHADCAPLSLSLSLSLSRALPVHASHIPTHTPVTHACHTDVTPRLIDMGEFTSQAHKLGLDADMEV
jgi:hypothetical protein